MVFAVDVPMPYVNGPLHAGHLYIITLADIIARYAQQAKNDSGFPFAFHWSGMISKPQHSAAVTEIQTEQKARHFTEQAIRDLDGLDLLVDTKFSFVTSEHNPYYDSFVRWQLGKLRQYMVYDTRPCIYSLNTRQACNDHEISSGEGACVLPYRLMLDTESGIFVVKEVDSGAGACIGSDTMNAMMHCQITSHNGQVFGGMMSPYLAQNLRCQGIMISETVDADTKPRKTGRYENTVIDTGITVHLTDIPVTDKFGDRCVVSLVEGWYINYSNPEWKTRVQSALSRVIIHDDDARKMLDISIRETRDTCISRKVCMGTKIPWDERYYVDSITDSSIYMAYYSSAQFLQRDIYGGDPTEPNSYPVPTDQFWDYVLLGVGDVDKPHLNTAQKCRRKFLSVYPLDLRVSGKDLAYNHLVVSMYHHVAIFGEDKCPREYIIRGHITVDDRKMSKYENNVITIASLKEQYRTDVLRLLVAETSDGLSDCCFKLHQYESTKASLTRFYELLEQYRFPHQPFDVIIPSETLRDQGFYQNLIQCLKSTRDAYSLRRTKDAIMTGFRKPIRLMNQYRTFGGDSPVLLGLCIEIMCYTMKPILPQICSGFGKTGPVDIDFLHFCMNTTVNQPLLQAWEYCDFTPSANKFTITVHHKVRSSNLTWTYIDKILHERGYTPQIIIDHTEIHANRDPFKIKPRIDPPAKVSQF